MSEIENFNELVERAMNTPGHAYMRPAIAKELLHYDILFCLDQNQLLDTLTFQGGTSLRLCYGAPRFSEDLDFAGGIDFESKNLVTMKSCLEDYIGKRYGLEITVKEPKESLKEPTNRNVNVDIWQLRLVTHP